MPFALAKCSPSPTQPPLRQHSDILVLRMPMTYGLNSS